MKFYYLKDIWENYHPVFPYLHDNFIILFFLSFIKYKSSQKKKIHFLIYLSNYNISSCLNDKRQKNLPQNSLKLPSQWGKMGESCRSRHATVGLLPISGKSRVPTFIFTCPSNQLRPIFTIFLRYINHPEEIARIVSSTFSFERWRARLHNLLSYVTRSRVYDKAKDRHFSLPREMTLDSWRGPIWTGATIARIEKPHNCWIPR